MKAKSIQPQQRSLQWLRRQEFIVESVEKWRRFPMPGKQRCRVCGQLPMLAKRLDLFGFGDLLAIKDSERWLIQVTDTAHQANRLQKITADETVAPLARAVLRAGFRIAVHGWRKGGPRGAAKHWQLTVQEVTEGMIQATSPQP